MVSGASSQAGCDLEETDWAEFDAVMRGGGLF